ncbi:hypothetical protein BGZ50_001498 [Haplosporangium sp. Z 11]|nr:hypothetical protein BGZ50_001498 [Haplosporangium sp. Z 11]
MSASLSTTSQQYRPYAALGDSTASLARKRPAQSNIHDHGLARKNLFSQLPLELAFLILCQLSYRGLVALSLVDHYWRELTFQKDGILWYRLCQRHSFLPGQGHPPRDRTLFRWTLAEAQEHRPGFTRALAQSRERLRSLETMESPHLSTNDLPTTAAFEGRGQHSAPPVFKSARLISGRIKSWRDYFEASIILEREWIEGKPPKVKELRGHNDAVLCVKALRQGYRVVSGDRAGCLRIWCAVTGECLKKFERHMMGVSCLAAQGDLLVSGSWDSTVIVWRELQEAPFLKPLKIIDLGEQVMSMDLDSNLDLVVGAVSGMVKIISINSISSLGAFQSPSPALCAAVSLSRNKVEAAIGLNYYAWDRSSRMQIGFIGDAHFENITCMKIDTNNRLLFTGSLDSKVRVFSWETKPMLLRQYGGHRDGVRCMALQDNMIITGSSDKSAIITFRDRHESYRPDITSHDGFLNPGEALEDGVDRVAEPVSFSHLSNVNAVEADASMLVTGADDGVVRIFDFGYDLWRPPRPSSPKLCGQTSLVSSTSSTCVLMARPGRNKVSVGNRRQTWGTCALAVLARAKALLKESQAGAEEDPVAWMNVDEIYQRMIEWEQQPVSQGSTPKHTLNLALHMMAKSDPPTVLLDSSVFPHRFALK